ncbi:MAG: OsmC family protein [Bacteroidia bacterium]|nr:OsmC family protein [Bacteroidia bacterium]
MADTTTKVVYKTKTSWVEKLAFDNQIDQHSFRIDGNGPTPEGTGPSPKKMLLTSLAACTGIDIVSMLEKMRVPITGLELDTEADLTEEHPKVFSEIRLTYRVFGENIDRAKVEKAVQLSKEKYCGVSAILEKNSPIKIEIEYVEA